MTPFTESVVEQVVLTWLEAPGWQVAHAAAVGLLERPFKEPERYERSDLAESARAIAW